jgi:hypothetical protein
MEVQPELVAIIRNSQVILSKLKSIKEGLSFSDLMVRTKLGEMDFYNAIGYLLKESRITFYNDKNMIRIKLRPE